MIGIRVAADAFAAFAAKFGINVETRMIGPIVRGATETFIPSQAVEDFNQIAQFSIAAEPAEVP